jgi:PPOX class probable F420-dependent enzyme
MQPQTIGPSIERSASKAGSGLDRRFTGKYLSLTSFKRDATGVATPVWFVIDDGRLLVKTGRDSFKVKRIQGNPAVMIAPCSASGRLRGEPVPAQPQVLPPGQQGPVERLMARKYRIDRVLILPIYRALQRLRGAPSGVAEVVVAITPTSATSGPKGSRIRHED